AVALLLLVLVLAINPRRQVLDQRYQIVVSSNPEQAKAILDEEHPFLLRGWRNVHIKVEAKSLDNAWVDIGGYLVNKDTDQIQQFEIPLEYYHGVEDGESWTEGSPEGEVYLSAQPSGTYLLFLECLGEKANMPLNVRVT